MIGYFQRRIARQVQAFHDPMPAHRAATKAWLRDTCRVVELKHDDAKTAGRCTEDGITIETVYLPQDAGFCCPAVVYRRADKADQELPAMILSHDSGESAADTSVAELAATLAGDGLVVVVPGPLADGARRRAAFTRP